MTLPFFCLAEATEKHCCVSKIMLDRMVQKMGATDLANATQYTLLRRNVYQIVVSME